jgi:hypothetical protein
MRLKDFNTSATIQAGAANISDRSYNDYENLISPRPSHGQNPNNSYLPPNRAKEAYSKLNKLVTLSIFKPFI